MTRRIAIAILLTVWATLIAAGATAYLTTRAVMLADLDQGLMARALALPQMADDNGRVVVPVAAARGGDRYIIRDDLGRTVGRPTSSPAEPSPPRLLRAAFARLSDGSRVRTVTLRVAARPLEGGDLAPATISYSGSAAQFDRLLGSLRWALSAVCIVGGALAAAVAWLVARRSLRPLRSTADVVGTIDEAHLSRRIDSRGLPTELVPVAERLNEMLSRLQESVQKRKHFMADASHELRTPVAALLTALEVALRRPREAPAYRETLETCLAEAQLLQRLVETLLTQVRSELSSDREYPTEQVNASVLLNECATAIRPLAEARSIELQVASPPQLPLRTQPDRMRSILLNLLGNSVEHNRDGGIVQASAEQDGGSVVIRIRDNGPGIAGEHIDHVFDPFYRADSARSSGHLGLGLFLVKTHVQQLGGSCRVDTKPGAGTAFEVRLPGVVEDPSAAATDLGRKMHTSESISGVG